MREIINIADVVVSKAGRDIGKYYLVVAIVGEQFVLLCNGQSRKIENPKLKKTKHIRKIFLDDEVQKNVAKSIASDDGIARELLSLTQKCK